MSSAIDGLISGLDTTTIISQLMQLEALPQTALKTKVATSDSFVSALQSLNTKLSSLATAATTAATATSWNAVSASSSAASVTSTPGTTAQASSLTFRVNSLATRQTSVGASVADLAVFLGGPTPATLTLATGSPTAPTVAEIDLTGVTDLTGLAAAINKAAVGVTASIVQVSATESRVQLTGKDTGVGAEFDLYSGSVSTVDLLGGTPPTAIMGRGSAYAITQAANASITLWAGVVGIEQNVTSTTNTFTGLLTGVDFTISKVEADPVTLTIARNSAALTTMASGLVSNIGLVLSEISSRTRAVSTTDSTGRTLVKGGILSGDSSVRSMQQALLTAASGPVGAVSPSSVGIVLGRDGTITFDATIFAAALAADPANVQTVISGLAARVQTFATDLSAPTTGALSLKITSQQSYVKTLGDQVLNWDTRLEMRRASLEKQYAGLEVALGKLNSQSSWLTSQLDALSANKA